MKKSILNFGKALNKAEQKSINGGLSTDDGVCPDSWIECVCPGKTWCVLSVEVCLRVFEDY
jgi:hypothetical protein